MTNVTTDCCDPVRTLLVTQDRLSDAIIDNIKIFRGEVQKLTGQYQLFNIFPRVNQITVDSRKLELSGD